MKQVGLAFSMYAQDYDETMCPLYIQTGSTDVRVVEYGMTWYADNYIITWHKLLLPYTKNVHVYKCPEAPGSDPGPTGVVNLNYGGNRAVFSQLDARPGGSQTVRTMAQVPRPADSIAVLDCGRWYYDWSLVARGSANSKWYIPGDPRPCGTEVNWCPKDKRHNGGVNVAFADGHAKWLKADVVVANPAARPMWDPTVQQ
jgi:prepilin-type processing-associated H-X9-DG protein